MCLNVNAEENSDPVYSETYLYDLIRDEMIPGVGDPDKANFDRIVGQAIRNPIAVEPVYGGGSIGFGLGNGFSAVELGRKLKGNLPSGTSTSPVIRWCNGVPYAYDGSDGTYYCIPPELYPQINDPYFWGGRPPWGDPMQRGEIDVNDLTNIPWIYLEQPETNGVDDEFVDLARRALGLVDSEDGVDGTQWPTGGWCSFNRYRKSQNEFYYQTTDLDLTKCYMIVESTHEESNGYTAMVKPYLYYASYDPNTNSYWWICQAYVQAANTIGWYGYPESDRNKHVENYRFNVLYSDANFPMVVDGVTYNFGAAKFPFGGIHTSGSIPLWYSSGNRPFTPGSFYDGDDVDGYWDNVGDVVGGLSPQQYENLPTTSTGNKKVPVDDPTNYPDTNVPAIQPITLLPTGGGDNGGGDNGGGDTGGGDTGGGDTGGGDTGGGDSSTPDGSSNNPIYVYPKVDPDVEFPPVVNTPEKPLFNVPDLTTFFPFCLVFDVGRALAIMLDGDQEPVFDVPLHLTYNNQTIVDYNFHLDLRDYGISTVVGYIKVIELIAYIIILCIATFRVLGGE